MDRTVFIINPIAGGGRTKKLIPDIDNIMKEKGIEYEIVVTTKPEEAMDITREKLKEGYMNIIAVGGDGTVNEVAHGIISFGKGNLGIIPSGTGNDLARTLNLPFDLNKAIDIILDKYTKKIDIGLSNDKVFLNIGSVGFDSEVVKRTNKIKRKVKSRFAYIIALFITIFKFDQMSVEISIDNFSFKQNILLIAIGNGKYYGGGINILPMADIADGYFNVLVVKNISPLKILVFLPTLINGSHLKQKKYVSTYKAKNVVIKARDNDLHLNLDGELSPLENESYFTMSKEKLSVIVSKK